MITFTAVWFYFAGMLYVIAVADGDCKSKSTRVIAVLLWPIVCPIASILILTGRKI
jgi:hypothetical protein